MSTPSTPPLSERDVLDALAADYRPLSEATKARLATLLGARGQR